MRPRRNLRLFAALYPPPEFAECALQMAREVLDGDLGVDETGVRMVPATQVHLTLQFIGDVPTRELDDVLESAARSVAGLRVCEMTPGALVTLPKRGDARLLALETDAPPTVLEIKRRLVTRFARAARAKGDDRFLPHLTLCRFRPPRPVDLPDRSPALPVFTFAELKLMRSVLDPGGAQHHELASYPLDAGR